MKSAKLWMVAWAACTFGWITCTILGRTDQTITWLVGAFVCLLGVDVTRRSGGGEG